MTTKRLRILLSAYACEPNRGSEPGIGWNWAITLAQLGHKVWVITRANNRDAIAMACDKLDPDLSANLVFLYYDLPKWAAWWKKGDRGVQLYYALWQKCILSLARTAHDENRFDVCHHLTFGVWRQPTQLYRLGIPLIFGPVGGGELAPPHLMQTLPPKPRIWEVFRATANYVALLNLGLRRCLRKTRWAIAKTKETAAWIEKAGGRCTVAFEIGIDANRFSANSENRSDGQLRCLFAGRLLGWKGVHLAVDAISRVRRSGVNASLTVIGQGPMRAPLEDQVRIYGLGGYVTFIDWLDQRALFDQYRHHDVLLFPSLHDSSGNVILEAFAHGLPTVCLDLGGPGELVNDTNGVAVDASNDPVAGLANALESLARDEKRRQRLSIGARSYAEATSWRHVVMSVYKEPLLVLGRDATGSE